MNSSMSNQLLGSRTSPRSRVAKCFSSRPKTVRATRGTFHIAASADTHGAAQVVAIGEALFDCLADQIGVPREKVTSWSPKIGGAPLNVVCCTARLGVPSAFVSSVGDDDFGRRILKMLDERGVNRQGVQISTRPTRDIYVVRSDSGDREFAGFGRPTEEYCDAHIEAGGLPLGLLESSRVLVTGTLGLAQPATREAIERAVTAAKSSQSAPPEQRPIVLVDVNWRPVFWADPSGAKRVIEPFVQRADIVKITDLEAQWLFGVDSDLALREPALVLDRLPQAKGVLVTAGEKGAAYAFHPQSDTHARAIEGFVPVMGVQVVDTTGAGDAFTGGFLAAMLQSGGLQALTEKPTQLARAVLIAAAAGGLTCTGPGAIDPQPTMQQIEELLEGPGKGKLKEAQGGSSTAKPEATQRSAEAA